MGSSSSVYVLSAYDDTIDDIYRMVFRPNERDILVKISKHVKKYPTCLQRETSCVLPSAFHPTFFDAPRVTGTPMRIAKQYSLSSSNEIIRHLNYLDYNEHVINANSPLSETPLNGDIYDIFKLIFMPKNEELLIRHLEKYPDATELDAYCYNIKGNMMGCNGKPLFVAACFSRYSSSNIIKLLLHTRRDNMNGKYSMHNNSIVQQVASRINTTSKFETLKMLLDAGFGIEPDNKYTPSTLAILCHFMINENYVEYIKQLLTYKPNIDAVNIYNHQCTSSNCSCGLIANKTPLDILHTKRQTSYVVRVIKMIEDYAINSVAESVA